MTQRNILLMHGPDHKGLIYQVTRILFDNNLNIIRNDEYVSPAGYFFMRTEFEGVAEVDSSRRLSEPLRILKITTWTKARSSRRM